MDCGKKKRSSGSLPSIVLDGKESLCRFALLAALSAIDTMMINDKQVIINLISTELLARRAYARERAFEDVFKEEDWKKPRADAKNWRTKVKTDLLVRFDPRMTEQEVLRLPGAEEEVRKEVDRDVAFEKARAKLEKVGQAVELSDLR